MDYCRVKHVKKARLNALMIHLQRLTGPPGKWQMTSKVQNLTQDLVNSTSSIPGCWSWSAQSSAKEHISLDPLKARQVCAFVLVAGT